MSARPIPRSPLTRRALALIDELNRDRTRGKWPKGGKRSTMRRLGCTEKQYDNAVRRARDIGISQLDENGEARPVIIVGRRGEGGHRLATSMGHVGLYTRQEAALWSRYIANHLRTELAPALELFPDPNGVIERAIVQLSRTVEDLGYVVKDLERQEGGQE